jgi:hypothetical protein
VEHGGDEYQRCIREGGASLYQAWCEPTPANPSRRGAAGGISGAAWHVGAGAGEGDWGAGQSRQRDHARHARCIRGYRDRLGRYFGTDPRFWLNLQTAHDLSKAEKARSYRKIVPRTAA